MTLRMDEKQTTSVDGMGTPQSSSQGTPSTWIKKINWGVKP